MKLSMNWHVLLIITAWSVRNITLLINDTVWQHTGEYVIRKVTKINKHRIKKKNVPSHFIVSDTWTTGKYSSFIHHWDTLICQLYSLLFLKQVSVHNIYLWSTFRMRHFQRLLFRSHLKFNLLKHINFKQISMYYVNKLKCL